MHEVIESIDGVAVGASPRSIWVFARVRTSSGRIGVGEATLAGSEAEVIWSIKGAEGALKGLPVDQLRRLAAVVPRHPEGLVNAATLSAIEQASWDLFGLRLGVPVRELFGASHRDRVPVYANINRATADRSPEGFAANAAAAVAQGFEAIKCAPFDGLTPKSLAGRDGRQSFERGLERVAEVRRAVGDATMLMIDCHWRFDAAEAVMAVRALEEFSPYWVEAPVSEHDLRSWRRVRRSTDMRLAGGEMLVGVRAYREFIEGSKVDVIMPDVKYVGGISDLRKVVALGEAFGVSVAPHNPSGPVGTAATVHAVAGSENVGLVEFQWGENAWRSELVNGAEVLVEGHLQLTDSAGLGTVINDELVLKHPGQGKSFTVDLGIL